MSEISSIKKKIHALLSKTVDNGCTENEALSAAAKAGELMDHFNLSITDIDIKQTGCKQITIELPTVISGPLDSVVVALAAFCDCKVWFNRGRKVWGGDITRPGCYNFFGLEPDVEMAEYLYRIIERAHKSSLGAFKKGSDYKFAPRKKTATKSFGYAFSARLSGRLKEMKASRDEALRDAQREERTGRNLVVVKMEQVESEFADVGIRLHKRSKSRHQFDSNAHAAGRKAGDKVGLNHGVGGQKQAMLT